MSSMLIEGDTSRPVFESGETTVAPLGSERTSNRPVVTCSASGNASARTYRTKLTHTVRGQRLEWPLPVEVRTTDQYTAVADPVSGIHGVGSTPTEALQDFQRALVEFAQELASHEELSPSMRRMMLFVSSLV